ncbi:MAG: FtsQ-type POTRA domain-containing protein [Hahellaceae bacterium]|nr:FtsQ-type POTRA domain-containing protein [Hahellaceae bacterium]MCP5169858.1 FtsQ-type POTRA domain-containing protein [Hahellaceae bacterium]
MARKDTASGESAAVRRGATPLEVSPRELRVKKAAAFSIPDIRLPWRKLVGSLVVVMFSIALVIGSEPLIAKLDRPIALVEVQGEFQYLPMAQLETHLQGFLGESFLAIDLDKVKQSAEALPWVYSASVQRVWPSKLVVQVTEQQPAARWNGDALLNVWGQIFTPDSLAGFDHLADLSGPDSEAIKVLSQFAHWQQALMKHSININGVRLEARGAWNLKLEDEVWVLLGRGELDHRLARFAKVYTRVLKPNVSDVAQIDVRYTNGIAVRWKEHAEHPEAKRG